MIKIIIVVLILAFIIIPLYQGESVSGVVKNIENTIENIRTSTPTWVKDLTIKVFSVAFELIKAIFGTIIDFAFDEIGEEVDTKIEDTKEDLKNGIMPGSSMIPSFIS